MAVVSHQDVRAVALVDESRGDREHRASYRIGESWSRTTTFELRADVRLSVGSCRFAPGFSFPVVQPPAELELVVSRGGTLGVCTSDGRVVRRGGHTVEVSRTPRSAPVHVRPDSDAPMDSLTVSMTERRLRELLGAPELPRAFRRVTEADDAYPVVSHASTPRLVRVLDELVAADVTGSGRLLWFEAKCLELVALITDEVVVADTAQTARLSQHDIDRLERARAQLVARLDEPPTLAALARTAGLNETKLKGGFRHHFGTSVFGYLRKARMEEARRLLATRQLNVSEVAIRVGYLNPSKFAAAFRREFGTSPSGRPV
jgi:AraC-like DNA-binding protein